MHIANIEVDITNRLIKNTRFSVKGGKEMLKKFVIGGWAAFTILLLVIVFVSPTFADNPRQNVDSTLYSTGSSSCCATTSASSAAPSCCATTAPTQSSLPSCCQ
jgi:hypothetical protein